MQRGERFNSISHLVGAALALAGLVLLVVQSSLTGDPWRIVSFSVYGTTLLCLYMSSTLYHSLRGRAREVFRRLDHVAIYLLIAGTYTPFALVTLRGPWGFSLLGIVWGLAVLGILQDLLTTRRPRVFSVVLYVLMGWLALAAIGPLARALPGPGMAGLVAGGALYTLGIVFFALDRRLPHGHGVFHLFVLAGSIAHYCVVLLYVA